MYLEYLINESTVIDDIESNEAYVLAEFKESFSLDFIYSKIVENLNSFIAKDDIVETYNFIKEFSKNYTLDYLINTSRKLS